MMPDRIQKPFSPPRWGQERRLEFIDFRLLWDRIVNRGELIDFFGISAQQASADLAQYQALAPANLRYNASRKRYEASAGFEPKFRNRSADDYLQCLLEKRLTQSPSPGNFIGWMPETDIVVNPARGISDTALAQLLWVVRHDIEVEITYQSMRRDNPERQWISPHAFGFDGTRWHARAWSYEREMFADFVLSRIQAIHSTRPGTGVNRNDKWWHDFVKLHLRPNSSLNSAQRKAVSIDYCMVNGQLILRARKAMAFYLLRSLRLDEETPKIPLEQPLELINRDEVQDVLAVGRKAYTMIESHPHMKGAHHD